MHFTEFDNYDFRAAGGEVPEEFEITDHRDYTDVARERVFDSERRELHENGELELESSGLPESETCRIADMSVLGFYMTESDPEDEKYFNMLVRDKSDYTSRTDYTEPQAEVVPALATLVHEELGIAAPETVNLPYSENDGEFSLATRFVPNVVDTDQRMELSEDSDWFKDTYQNLHDAFVFNWWTNSTRDLQQGYTPSGDIVLFDFENDSDIGGNVTNQKTRDNTLETSQGYFVNDPYEAKPTRTQVGGWRPEKFERAVETIENIEREEIETAVGNLPEESRELADIDGLMKRKEVLDEVFLEDSF